MVTTGVVGDGVPIAAGLALASVLRGTRLDLRCLVALDRDAVSSVARTLRLLAVHAATRFTGPGAEDGQPIDVLETEKVEMEVEALAAGTIHRVVQEGVTYAVGAAAAPSTARGLT
jgi:pyruvate/2-oxoglutarate/acetoin dehydrogenase E1 component